MRLIATYLSLLALCAAPAVAAPDAPRIFIASDSTAQDYMPAKYPQAGWGTMLRCAFRPGVIVENRAIGGRSTRTFINEGRLDAIAHDIRAGDTLLIQFGHNDANTKKPERFADIPDYKVYLLRYIATATNVGARAVLLTPVTRRNWVDGKVEPSFATYSQAAREVAAATHTPLIDLDALSRRWVMRAGVEPSRAYFLPDDTHFTELGARGVANIVAGSLQRLGLPISRQVLHRRPALTLTRATGGPSCDVGRS